MSSQIPRTNHGAEVKWSPKHVENVIFAEDCKIYRHNLKKNNWDGSVQQARLYILKDVKTSHRRLLCVDESKSSTQIISNSLIQPSSGTNIRQLDRSTATMVWIPDTRYEKTSSLKNTKETKGYFLTVDFNQPVASTNFNNLFKAAVTDFKVNRTSHESKRESKTITSSSSAFLSENKNSEGSDDGGLVSMDSLGSPLVDPGTSSMLAPPTGERKKLSLRRKSATPNNKTSETKSVFGFGGSFDPSADKDQAFGFGETKTTTTSTSDAVLAFGSTPTNGVISFDTPTAAAIMKSNTKTMAKTKTAVPMFSTPSATTPDIVSLTEGNDENRGSSTPASALSGLGASTPSLSQQSQQLPTNAMLGEDPLNVEVMTRRLKQLYAIKKKDNGDAAAEKAVKKYKQAGPSGMCTLSEKLGEKYPDDWQHVNPNHVKPYTSPKKKSSASSSSSSSSSTSSSSSSASFSAITSKTAPPSVSFGGGAASNGAAPVNFGFGNNTAVPSFGDGAAAVSFGDATSASSFGDGTAAPSFGDGAAPAVSFGGAAATSSFGDGTAAPSFGDGAAPAVSFGGDAAAASFGGGSFGGGDAPTFGAGAFDPKSFTSAGNGDQAATGGGGSAFGAVSWGSAEPAATFGGGNNNNNNATQQPANNAFAAMGNASVSFGSPSTR